MRSRSRADRRHLSDLPTLEVHGAIVDRPPDLAGRRYRRRVRGGGGLPHVVSERDDRLIVQRNDFARQLREADEWPSVGRGGADHVSINRRNTVDHLDADLRSRSAPPRSATADPCWRAAIGGELLFRRDGAARPAAAYFDSAASRAFSFLQGSAGLASSAVAGRRQAWWRSRGRKDCEAFVMGTSGMFGKP